VPAAGRRPGNGDGCHRVPLGGQPGSIRVQRKAVLPAGRKYYVSPEDTRAILAACNPTWRIIVALARYGGLRCPSEVLSLKWEHVNFETNRMSVPSCKTEHHPGRAYRVCPIFVELRPYLDEAFDLAVDGAE
jgi:integrase